MNQGAPSINGAGPFKVVGYSGNVGLPANGYIRRFAIYSRALSAAEISALGSGCSSPICTASCTGKVCGDDDGCGGKCNVPCSSDGNACNGVETCTPATGSCAGTPVNCDDGNICNGAETCVDPAGTCSPGIPLTCGTSGCVSGSGCTSGPVVSSLTSGSSSPHSIVIPVSVTFTLSDAQGDSSSIIIDWGDGIVDTFPGPYAPGTVTLGSHTYADTGTYCVKVCANDGTGTGICDAAFFASLVCSKKRAPGGAAFSLTVSRFSAGGDPYFLGYDGKTFEFHGNPGEAYNLISSVTKTDKFFLNVQFGKGNAANPVYSMGVVMRSIGLLVNQLRIVFTVSEEGDVHLDLNGNEISSFRNETIDGVKLIFEPDVNFSRAALHMSAHEVHHHLLIKTPLIMIQMFGVRYQPPPWKSIPNAPFFHFVDLEANIIDPTFCPDGVWGSTACGGHHDSLIDSRYRIHGDDILGENFDGRI